MNCKNVFNFTKNFLKFYILFAVCAQNVHIFARVCELECSIMFWMHAFEKTMLIKERMKWDGGDVIKFSFHDKNNFTNNAYEFDLFMKFQLC